MLYIYIYITIIYDIELYNDIIHHSILYYVLEPLEPQRLGHRHARGGLEQLGITKKFKRKNKKKYKENEQRK